MIDERASVRVGAVTLVLCGVAVVAILGAGRLRWRKVVRFEVEFDHVGNLHEGADVQVGGQVVGEVESIALSRRGAVVHATIERRYRHLAPQNAEIFVSSRGLLADRYLAIGPPPEGEAPAGPIASGGPPLRGISPVLVERVILTSIQNTARFRALLDEVRPQARALVDSVDELGATLEAIEGHAGQYGELAAKTGRLALAAGETRQRLEASGVSRQRVEAIAGRAEAVAGRLEAALAPMERDIDGVVADVRRLRGAVPASSLLKARLAVHRARELAARAKKIAAATRALAAAVRRGEGTVGALLYDPEFINEAKELGKIIKRHPWRLLGTDRERRR